MKRIEAFFNRIKNKKILIQGLGVNGGGSATALFFLENGFDVTITDMKDENELASSIRELEKFKDKIRYVLGRHEISDFKEADIVVKGPGVNPSSEYIRAAVENKAEILSDIGIFLELCPCPVYAVTGSKGKSTTVSAVYSIFKEESSNSFLGGNITISPLTFYDKLNEKSLVVLELSSWQLRDIKEKKYPFKISVITNLMNDHQNYYKSMTAYLNDKKIISDYQSSDDIMIIPSDDQYLTKDVLDKGQIIVELGRNLYYKNGSGYLNDIKLFDEADITVKGSHNKNNILYAAGLSYLAGCSCDVIQRGIRKFNGVPFRMELIREWGGMKFVNDTTATIPEAALSAVKSYTDKLIWIAGGNDKDLDFTCLKSIENIPLKIYFLPGQGTEKIKKIFTRTDYIEKESLEAVIKDIADSPVEGALVLLSPGCTSFGLFQNEFHRGRVFNKEVNEL